VQTEEVKAIKTF